MSANRRDFIKQTSTALLGGISINDLPSLSPPYPDSIADEEQYWKQIRKQFPLDKNVVYLNNGTLGPSPYPVIDTTTKGMQEIDQYINYAGWEDSSKKIASFVGADENEIALTHNTTEGINIYTWGLPLQKGDEVIITTHEHAGNALPWLNRQKLHGIRLKTFVPADTASETLNRINALISSKTKAIAVPHILCTQGQVLPVKEICALGKSKGLFVVVDGAHAPGMMPLNLHDLGCDAYSSCCHKWMLGPKGTGFLYVRKEFQETLQPYFVGAGSDNAQWNMATDPVVMGSYAASAHRYYGGTQNVGLWRGVNVAIDFIDQIGIDKIHKRILYLGKYTQDKLLQLGTKVELLTPTETISYCGINGFRVTGIPFNEFNTKVIEQGIRIRAVAENNMRSLRISTHIYNNTDQVDRLIEIIQKA
jgi:cysteine desulfurase/selenocysteine lyase